MVRIIYPENKQTAASPSTKLEQHHIALLNMVGRMIAEDPASLQNLLKNYRVRIVQDITDEQLSEILLQAIARQHEKFNLDLAYLVLDHTLKDEYDNFNFKDALGKAGSFVAKVATNVGQGGLVGGIAQTVGQIGGAIAQKGSDKKAQAEAEQQARQALIAQRKKQAQDKAIDKRNKQLLIIGVVFILGIGALALMSHLKNQNEQITY